jgi:hypothetical protein
MGRWASTCYLRSMKRLVLVGYLAGMAFVQGNQPFQDPDDDGPLPKTPTAFETQNTGVQKDEVAKFPDKNKKAPEKRNFTAVSEMRTWRDAKGAIIRGRLLAFEAGDQSTSAAPLTLIRNGKVRLLVEGRKMFSELPLARLSPEDQAYVKALDAARRKKASASNNAETGR